MEQQQKFKEHNGQATASETLAISRALATKRTPATAIAAIPVTSRTSNCSRDDSNSSGIR
jgi:hypothetical protein